MGGAGERQHRARGRTAQLERMYEGYMCNNVYVEGGGGMVGGVEVRVRM